MDLGKKIKALRSAKDWSTNRLADESGVSRAYVWQLETGGKVEPSFSIIEKLARALGVCVSEFCEEDQDSPTEAELPAGLREFVQAKKKEHGITKADIGVMRNTHFRGKQPDSPEDWELLFLFLRKWVR